MNYDFNQYSLNGLSTKTLRKEKRRKKKIRQLRILVTIIILTIFIVTRFYILSTNNINYNNNISAETSNNSIKENKFDYSIPVPTSEEVDKSYFNDAVFIGDSRTEGFILFTGLSNAISYSYKGLKVDTVFTNPIINMDGKKVSVMDALKSTSFSKVYIMFGINEIGWAYSDLFIQKYSNIIDEIKKINPDSLIYVQSIWPVSKKVSSSHSYIRNEKINEYNSLLQKMAENKKVYYVNSAEAILDANGFLPEEASVDGIHLKKDYYLKCLDYLTKHTVNEKN